RGPGYRAAPPRGAQGPGGRRETASGEKAREASDKPALAYPLKSVGNARQSSGAALAILAPAPPALAPGRSPPCTRSPHGPKRERPPDGRAVRWALWDRRSGGGGIRTHGTPEGTLVFETSPFDHSGTPPNGRQNLRTPGRRRGEGPAKKGRARTGTGPADPSRTPSGAREGARHADVRRRRQLGDVAPVARPPLDGVADDDEPRAGLDTRRHPLRRPHPPAHD